MQPNVSILALLSSEQLLAQLREALDPQCYSLERCATAETFIEHLSDAAATVDCLLLDGEVALPSLFTSLRQNNVLLPVVILASSEISASPAPSPDAYHPAEVNVAAAEIKALSDRIDAAIKQFIQLSPKAASLTPPAPLEEAPLSPGTLLEQQQRLANKLKERLGYLGVYYKRSSDNFYHNLGTEQQQQVIKELTTQYQAILLAYFSDKPGLNGIIDEFVNLAFFTDISVTQIVEIHMKLIDDYSKQLRLEGRDEAVLVNYRLTLLDVISHICEMYRRSIPRES